MTDSATSVTAPKLYIFDYNPPLADSLARASSQFGLFPEKKIINKDMSLDQNNLVVWVLSDPTTQAPEVIRILTKFPYAVSKTLITFPVDTLYQSIDETTRRKKEIEGYINKINKICFEKRVDVRFIAHTTIYALDAVGEGSALAALIDSHRRGATAQFDVNLQLYPLNATDLAPQLIKLWLDRGHRSQTILIKGEPLSASALNRYLPPTNISISGTAIGEGITHHDTIKINSDTSILYQYISQQIVPPRPTLTTLSPTPTPPKILRKNPTKKWLKPTKYGLITLIAALIAFIFVTYGLFGWALMRANQFNPESGVTMDQQMQQLNNAYIRFLKLNPLQTIEKKFNQLYLEAQQALLHKQINYLGINTFSMMLGAQQGDVHKSITQIRFTLDQLYQLESTTRSELDTINQLEFLRQLLLVYPQIIPETKKITLLLLFQNNLELRPTGGFIGSVAMLTLDRGKLLNIETRNIYDLDSNLRGLVQPPNEISQYLNETSWYFRDSNWAPDFTQAAVSANWFLEKEWGSRADLILGLNLNALQNIIKETSITLTNGTVINSDNLLITLLNSQDVAANANQPEMMSQIFTSLINHLNQSNSNTKRAVIAGFYQSLVDGEVTLASTNPKTQQLLDDLKLSGALYTPDCMNSTTKPCVADHFYLNEANVGINKANYYLSRKSTHQTSLVANNLAHSHTVELQNQSPDNTWPAGNYKAYYRVHLPVSAYDLSVTIDNQRVATDRLAASNYRNTRVIGWYHEIPPQSNSVQVISYKLPLSGSLGSYQMFFQKQPGQLSAPLTFTFSGSGLPYSVTMPFSRHLTIPIALSP